MNEIELPYILTIWIVLVVVSFPTEHISHNNDDGRIETYGYRYRLFHQIVHLET
ncbi:hypothetical protein DERP_001941, partial [Dermatophagoides pteronyssinus]